MALHKPTCSVERGVKRGDRRQHRVTGLPVSTISWLRFAVASACIPATALSNTCGPTV